MIILQILGGIFLALVLLALAVYLYFRVKLGKYFNAEKTIEPLMIHLTEDVSPEWLNTKVAKAKLKQLTDLGFEQAKAYTVDEMPVDVCALFKDEMTAVLYKHEIAGVWIDILVETVSGQDVTYSNAPFSSDVTNRPNSQKIHCPDETASQLYEKAKDKISLLNEPLIKIAPNEFRNYFESAYEKDIAWKNHKGGISLTEFEKIADETPFRTNTKDRRLAFIETKEDELYQWHDAAIQKYLKNHELSESTFFEKDIYLIIVPFTTDATAFIHYLEMHNVVSDDYVDKLIEKFVDEKDTFKLFDDINELFSPTKRAQYVEDMDFPLHLKLYSLPNYDIDSPRFEK